MPRNALVAVLPFLLVKANVTGSPPPVDQPGLASMPLLKSKSTFAFGCGREGDGGDGGGEEEESGEGGAAVGGEAVGGAAVDGEAVGGEAKERSAVGRRKSIAAEVATRGLPGSALWQPTAGVLGVSATLKGVPKGFRVAETRLQAQRNIYRSEQNLNFTLKLTLILAVLAQPAAPSRLGEGGGDGDGGGGLGEGGGGEGDDRQEQTAKRSAFASNSRHV